MPKNRHIMFYIKGCDNMNTFQSIKIIKPLKLALLRLYVQISMISFEKKIKSELKKQSKESLAVYKYFAISATVILSGIVLTKFFSTVNMIDIVLLGPVVTSIAGGVLMLWMYHKEVFSLVKFTGSDAY